jgi:hypothetical protein
MTCSSIGNVPGGSGIIQLVRVSVEVGNGCIPLVVVGVARQDQVNIVLQEQGFPDLAAVFANGATLVLTADIPGSVAG